MFLLYSDIECKPAETPFPSFGYFSVRVQDTGEVTCPRGLVDGLKPQACMV